MVIIVTGSRKGIGKQISSNFIQQGHTVIGCSRSTSSENSKKYHHFCLDICDEQAVVKMVRNVKRKFGTVDVLINNAGIASMNHTLTTTLDKSEQIIKTNILGTFLMTREVAKVMAVKKSGRIINFSSVAAGLSLPGEAIYAASKSAIENFTKTTAKELAEYNITVNAIAPTPIETDLIKNIPKYKINSLVDKQAINRLGNIEDVQNVIDFFISERSNFVTGQTIYLGGVNG